MGNTLVKVLICFYICIAAAYGYERDWARLVYWFGAIVLNVGVLTMK